MNITTPVGLSAIETLKLLDTGRVCPAEINKVIGEHIRRTEPDINAFDSLAQNEPHPREGVLKCLPISVKDQFAVAGFSRNLGLDKANGKKCDWTAPVIQKLIDQGACIIGKTNLPPYAMDFQTYNRRAGRTNNPWNLQVTPGGSSGGGAAAVSSGMSIVDIGSDMSGSLRIPAAFCGVFSLLPGENRIDNNGMLPKPGALKHFARPGPIARHVEDLELVWSVISGEQPGEETNRRFKLGIVSPAPEHHPVQEEISKCFRAATDRFAEGEVSCNELSLNFLFTDEIYQVFGEIMGYETGALIPAPFRWLMRRRSGALIRQSPRFLKPIYSGYRRNKPDYLAALEHRKLLQQRFNEEFDGNDAIMLPVCPVQPFPHVTAAREVMGSRNYQHKFEINGRKTGYYDCLTHYTVPIGLMGNPVITLPLGLDSNGLPIGAQLVGKPRQERHLLQIVKTLSTLSPALRSPYIVGD